MLRRQTAYVDTMKSMRLYLSTSSFTATVSATVRYWRCANTKWHRSKKASRQQRQSEWSDAELMRRGYFRSTPWVGMDGCPIWLYRSGRIFAIVHCANWLCLHSESCIKLTKVSVFGYTECCQQFRLWSKFTTPGVGLYLQRQMAMPQCHTSLYLHYESSSVVNKHR